MRKDDIGYDLSKSDGIIVTMNIDKVALIYIKDGKVLVARSKGKDVWYLPGGKREGDEGDEECLTREIMEELDVTLLAEGLTYYGVFSAQAHGKPKGVEVEMRCYTGEYEGELKPSAEIEEISWLDSTVKEELLSPVDRIIFAHLKSENLID